MGGDVDRALLAIQGIKVLGKRLPVPAQPFVQRRTGNVFDALHHLNELIVEVRSNRREAHAAVAHRDGGHAVMRRGREPRIPRCLAVVVRVRIDEPRRHEESVGVYLAATLPDVIADRDDPVALYRDVAPSLTVLQCRQRRRRFESPDPRSSMSNVHSATHRPAPDRLARLGQLLVDRVEGALR